MTKTVSIITTAIAVLTAATGGYFIFTRTQVTSAVERPEGTTPPTDPHATAPRPKPEHGNFQRRFEPKPPPPNGGKFN